MVAGSPVKWRWAASSLCHGRSFISESIRIFTGSVKVGELDLDSNNSSRALESPETRRLVLLKHGLVVAADTSSRARLVPLKRLQIARLRGPSCQQPISSERSSGRSTSRTNQHGFYATVFLRSSKVSMVAKINILTLIGHEMSLEADVTFPPRFQSVIVVARARTCRNAGDGDVQLSASTLSITWSRSITRRCDS